MSRTAKGVQELTRKKEYNVIAQLVCTHRLHATWRLEVFRRATRRGDDRDYQARRDYQGAAPVASQGLA